ncbi:hypothetical protein VTN96DRAFT_5967 [Rasamsonia emersonii]
MIINLPHAWTFALATCSTRTLPGPRFWKLAGPPDLLFWSFRLQLDKLTIFASAYFCCPFPIGFLPEPTEPTPASSDLVAAILAPPWSYRSAITRSLYIFFLPLAPLSFFPFWVYLYIYDFFSQFGSYIALLISYYKNKTTLCLGAEERRRL